MCECVLEVVDIFLLKPKEKCKHIDNKRKDPSKLIKSRKGALIKSRKGALINRASKNQFHVACDLDNHLFAIFSKR